MGSGKGESGCAGAVSGREGACGAGAVYIQEDGCGFSTLLVVTGPHRGQMWFDGRATCDQILPSDGPAGPSPSPSGSSVEGS
ncbi:hypothetical protein GCM10010215_77270 [Streptomyces virginiae]|uniref:Uncharacterized protein n=1 Tax=Streptomyces virginiae TaxID=1961 RepID=A0ABQ3NMT3_STRVG|nr:hypothetical protein GCM10010215_77270 [Streptomyces virginiae]GHI14086.1 hypothetical protein Scinn_35490 [Streptomyces virginiae]GLV96336.1 hypothetical protein Slala04_77890 [Streptomyces lavendulae subsp. lavendulae]